MKTKVLIIVLTGLVFKSFSQAVGIGSSSFTPGSTLSVDGNVSIGNGYRATANAITNGMMVEGNVAIGTSSTSYKLEVNGGTGNGHFRFTAASVNPILTITGDATNGHYPSIEFNPVGSSAVGGVLQSNSSAGGLALVPRDGPVRITPTVTNKTNLLFDVIANQTADAFQVQNYTTQAICLSLTPTSSTDRRMKLYLYNTFETTPTNYERLAIYADGTNNIFRLDAQQAGTGTQRNLTLQSSAGNVGIGTTDPTQLLQISTALQLFKNGGESRIDAMAGQQLVLGGNQTTGIVMAAIYGTSGTVRLSDNAGWITQEFRNSAGGTIYGSIGIDGTNDFYVKQGSALAFNVLKNDGTNLMKIQADGNVGLGCTNPTQVLYITGNAYATGSFLGSQAACSDVRWKKNFTAIETNTLAKILTLNAYRYDWRIDEFPDKKFSDKREVGFKAQEVEKLYPELIFTDDEGYKYLDYARLTPLLLEAIKEQQQQILELQNTFKRQQQYIEILLKKGNITTDEAAAKK